MVLVLIKQIVAMVIMMAVGVILVRAKMVDEKGVAQLSSIALYVATPAVIIQAFAVTFSQEQLVNGAWVALFTLVSLVVSTALAALILARSDRVGRFATIFSNAGFVGIPIIQALLGPEYVFYVTIVIAVSTLYLWTYGVVLMSADKTMVSINKVANNPAMIALVIGLALFFLPIELPDVASTVLTSMGNLNTGLAMIVLGANLGMANVSLMFSDLRLYRASAMRLLAVPAVVIAILLVLPIPYEVKMVLLIAQATPTAASTSMLAQLFGADYQYGTGLVIMTTIISMLTMPIMLTIGINAL